ncbi:oxygen-independent coproporphyrinogen III oxidase [Bacillus aquiflavi]|uniref:Heme chaperone HemW n=1 Tax=Bacillus aquiflavi TaxID=2672567 RepID=A0A6B3VWU8_9BACI|nr:radical SAM family heme chaperone HemW [Bacillus aquiflavi]MBA4535888.1 oxygen-independent coproporphyrinogen III oxidase [Bacillus aquiflavi]NEY80263.1 oxygen-independent coproporphyrinogen III oxidase [Bacillus aquiflavi]UAC47307.1 radical SAM family heme chaperone HemW [Bacillus aquiflavi]
MVNAAYIHIPFCEHICYYCDFNKVFIHNQPVEEYLNNLEKEIQLTIASSSKSSILKSIFVGGGTPTALNEHQLEKLCHIIQRQLRYNYQTEFTFEANPGDLSIDKLEILKEIGVNRISLGVQTFNDLLLEKIGRVHRAKDVFKSIDLATKVGFKNISIDLIYRLPGQTINDFNETLETALSLNVQHYSGYSLIVEPKTVFYNLMRKGALPLPEEETDAMMYELLIEKMDKHGFKQYEISNFSLPSYESKHNLTYWNNEEYYGFGAGAHSYLNGYRRSNVGPLTKYFGSIQKNVLPVFEENHVSKREKMEEEMFLGLRKTEGVSIRQFTKKYGLNPLQLFFGEIQTNQEKGLLTIKEDWIRLTKKGRFLGNEVFQSFIGVI